MAILLFSLLFFSNESVAQEQDSSLPFRPNIDWALFKGIPTDDTSAAALSASIKLDVAKRSIWTGKLQFKAYAVMYPTKSWVHINHATQALLQHEQTHFDITELCARGLQAELNKINVNKKVEVETIQSKWQKKLDDLQKQYDNETRHGTNPDFQKEWTKSVSTQLDTK